MRLHNFLKISNLSGEDFDHTMTYRDEQTKMIHIIYIFSISLYVIKYLLFI